MNQHGKKNRTKHEEDECELNIYTIKKLLSFPTKVNNNNNSQSPSSTENKSYKSNNKKQSNKGLCCPFACPTCQSLGRDLVKSKYEIINILSDTGDSIFSPMHERYHDDYEDDHRSRIRNDDGGQVFLSVDLVNPIFTNSRNRSFKQIEY
jgi:hypothetical protein